MLIGRDAELAVLDALITQASAGVGGVVLLTGEPGVGKTQLARAGTDRAAQGDECRGAPAGEERRAPADEGLAPAAMPTNQRDAVARGHRTGRHLPGYRGAARVAGRKRHGRPGPRTGLFIGINGTETPVFRPGMDNAASPPRKCRWCPIVCSHVQVPAASHARPAGRCCGTHCGHARYVWNLAVEQHAHWRPGWPAAPGYLEQCRQLTQARATYPWLAAGSRRSSSKRCATSPRR